MNNIIRVNKGNIRSNIFDAGRDPCTETGQSRVNSRIKYSEKLSNQQHRLGCMFFFILDRLGLGPFLTMTISDWNSGINFGPDHLDQDPWQWSIVNQGHYVPGLFWRPIGHWLCVPKVSISDPKISKGVISGPLGPIEIASTLWSLTSHIFYYLKILVFLTKWPDALFPPVTCFRN